jgi:hypothetical protein
MAGVIADGSRADAGAFLSRLVRLDPAAVVRLRPVRAERAPSGGFEEQVLIWARLPFDALVVRGLAAAVERDVTVRASELLTAVGADRELPVPRDADWRWPLPPPAAVDVETVPADDVLRVAAAAADTARAVLGSGIGGRAVGSRRVRDALLDHVPIVVDADGQRVEVPQRLVQAVVRMGFVTPGSRVIVRRAAAWVGLAGEHGVAWHRPIGESLNLHVSPYQTNG